MKVVEQALRDSLKGQTDKEMVFLRPSTFSFFRTYDGIKACGDKVIDEIFLEIQAVKRDKKIKITDISIVGYSLGGLISRYVIGQLYEVGLFNYIQPGTFTTFATPHLGVRFFKDNIFDHVANFLGSRFLGQSGRDLFQYRSTILLEMTHGSYLKGLAQFKRRILLANVKNDRSVSFYTSYITQYSPFVKWDSISFKFLEGAAHARISPKKKSAGAKIVDLLRTNEKSSQNSRFSFKKLLRLLGAIMLVACILPVWFPFVLIVSSGGTLQSKIRISLLREFHIAEDWEYVREYVYGSGESPNPRLPPAKKRTSRFFSKQEGDVAAATGEVVEGFLNAEDNIVHGMDDQQEEQEDSSDEEEAKKFLPFKSLSDLLGGQVDYDFDQTLEVLDKYLFEEQVEDQIPLFNEMTRLPFDEMRVEMNKALNSLGWLKLAVYLDAFNAHDGILARRGVKTCPRGASTVYLWASIIRREV